MRAFHIRVSICEAAQFFEEAAAFAAAVFVHGHRLLRGSSSPNILQMQSRHNRYRLPLELSYREER